MKYLSLWFELLLVWIVLCFITFSFEYPFKWLCSSDFEYPLCWLLSSFRFCICIIRLNISFASFRFWLYTLHWLFYFGFVSTILIVALMLMIDRYTLKGTTTCNFDAANQKWHCKGRALLMCHQNILIHLEHFNCNIIFTLIILLIMIMKVMKIITELTIVIII